MIHFNTNKTASYFNVYVNKTMKMLHEDDASSLGAFCLQKQDVISTKQGKRERENKRAPCSFVSFLGSLLMFDHIYTVCSTQSVSTQSELCLNWKHLCAVKVRY